MSDFAGRTIETARAKAESLECKIDTPNPNQLFLDIDSEEDFLFFQAQAEILRENGIDFVYAWSFSKSGTPRRHVRACIIGRDVLTEHERLELQAILGSDRKRELLAWLQIENGWNPTPTLFFEPKGMTR